MNEEDAFKKGVQVLEELLNNNEGCVSTREYKSKLSKSGMEDIDIENTVWKN